MTPTALHRPHPSRRGTPRSGMVLVAAMICLLAATALCGNVVRSILLRHHDVVDAGVQLQAEWLCEAGLQRALAAARADPAYEGETWVVPKTSLPEANEATVVLTAIGGDSRRLTARVVYSVGGLQRVVVEQSVAVPTEEPITE